MALTRNFYEFIRLVSKFSAFLPTTSVTSNYVYGNSSTMGDHMMTNSNGTKISSLNYSYFCNTYTNYYRGDVCYYYNTSTDDPNEYIFSSNPNIQNAAESQRIIFGDITAIPYLFKVGSSNEIENVLDYNCKELIDIPVTIDSRTIINNMSSFDLIYNIKVYNNTEQKIEIKEIACFKPIQFSISYDYKAYSQIKYVCIDRTVFEESITLQPGDYKIISFTMHLNT